MEELKWCEIGPVKTERFEFLSEYLKSKSIPNTFKFIEATDANLKEKIEEAKKENLFIRFNPKVYHLVTSNISNNTRDLEILRSVDSLMHEKQKGYWPALFLKDAIFEYLTLKVKNLDVSQKAFIVGSCGSARAGIAALVKLGFSKINITGEDDQASDEMIKDFKEIFFNVEFESTKRKDITILPGIHGFFLNTFSFLDSDNFPTEIYFLNFLKKGGLVIDVHDVPLEPPLAKIAIDIGATVIPGYELLGFYDLYWFNKATGQKAELEPYLDILKTKLLNVSYDKSKEQKILEEFQI